MVRLMLKLRRDKRVFYVAIFSFGFNFIMNTAVLFAGSRVDNLEVKLSDKAIALFANLSSALDSKDWSESFKHCCNVIASNGSFVSYKNIDAVFVELPTVLEKNKTKLGDAKIQDLALEASEVFFELSNSPELRNGSENDARFLIPKPKPKPTGSSGSGSSGSGSSGSGSSGSGSGSSGSGSGSGSSQNQNTSGNVTGDLNVSQNLHVTQGLNVAGSTKLSGDTDVYGCFCTDVISPLPTKANGTIDVKGNLNVAPGKTLQVNKISPAQSTKDVITDSLEITGNLVVDGTSTFEDGIATNTISPESGTKVCVEGDLVIQGADCKDENSKNKKLIVNRIAPAVGCEQNNFGTTLFEGKVAIESNKSLLVNRIDPLSKDVNCNPVADSSLTTTMGGNVSIEGALSVKGDIATEPCSKILTNEINPVKFDACGNLVAAEDLTTCFSGNVAVSSDKALRVNKITAVKTDLYGNCVCDGGVDASVCVEGKLAIDPGEGCIQKSKLLVNDIAPVIRDGDHCIEDLNGRINVHGDVIITKHLYANLIDPIPSVDANPCDCIPPVSDGCTQFSGSVSIPNNRLLVNEINPVNPNDPCEADDNGITCFSGNAAINPCKTLFVNEIDPVKMENGVCVKDPDGCTEFSGNVAITDTGKSLVVNQIIAGIENSCESDEDSCVNFLSNLSIPSKKLFVNEIAAVKDKSECVCEADPDGCIKFNNTVTIPNHTLLVNEINPVHENSCIPNDDGCTKFSGHVSISPEKLLLVNEINPVSVYDPCMPDDNGTTRFSGNVAIDKDLTVKQIFVNKIDPIDHCTEFSGDISLGGNKILTNEINPVSAYDPCEPDENGTTVFSGNVKVNKDLTVDQDVTVEGDLTVKNTIFVNEIDPQSGTCTHFSGDVSLNGNKLLVNEINPVDPYDPCKANDNGITCFSGNVAVNPGKTLYVQNICGINDNCQPSENATVNICNIEFDKACIDQLGVEDRLLVNEINPVMNVYGECVPDEDGCTQFSGNVSIPYKKLLVNEINPVSAYNPCEADDDGITCFSGNVAVTEGKTLYVNSICGVNGCNPDPNAKITICNMESSDSCIDNLAVKQRLLVNEINPVNPITCQPNENGCTNFSGNVSIDPTKVLHVNEINPTKGFCFPDPSGCTRFSGNVAVSGNSDNCDVKLLVNDIGSAVKGTCLYAGNGTTCVHNNFAIVPICDPNFGPTSLLVNHINPVKSILDEGCFKCVENIECNATTCFGGNLAVAPECCFDGQSFIPRKFLANYISPVKYGVFNNQVDKCVCESDPSGTICIDGSVAIPGSCNSNLGPTNSLLVNFIGPVRTDLIDINNQCATCFPDTRCEATTCFTGNLAVAPECCFDENNQYVPRRLLTNNIGPVKYGDNDDKCICEYDIIGTVCVDGNLAIANTSPCLSGPKLLVNTIAPIQVTINPNDPKQCMICEENTNGTVGIKGNLAVDSNYKLFVNEINPVKPGTCEPNEDGYTCFSGNVVINPGKKLHVEEICGVEDICTPSITKSVVLCNTTFVQDSCFDTDLSIKNGYKLLVNEINPVSLYGTCDEDDNGTTMFSGNVDINKTLNVDGTSQFNENVTIKSGKKLLVNEIDPVPGDTCTIFSGNVALAEGKQLLVDSMSAVKNGCEADSSGIICIGSNVGIKHGHKLLVNQIDPIKTDGSCVEDDNLQICVSGKVALQGRDCDKAITSTNYDRELWVNVIAPVDKNYNKDLTHSTCFAADAAVDPTHKFLVNEINPVKLDSCGRCVEDDTGTTVFSGHVKATKNLIVDGVTDLQNTWVNKSLTVHGPANFYNTTCFDDNVIINPGYKLHVEEICGVKGICEGSMDTSVKLCNTEFTGDSCFDTDLSIKNGHKLLVNEINPVSRYGTCEVDDNGITEFSGNVAIDKKLYLKEICILKETTVEDGGNHHHNHHDEHDDMDSTNSVLVCSPIIVTEDSCFRGDLAIDPLNKLLVNEINPVRFDPYLMTCVEDDDATTVFSGNVKINKQLNLGCKIHGGKHISFTTTSSTALTVNFNAPVLPNVSSGALISVRFIGNVTSVGSSLYNNLIGTDISYEASYYTTTVSGVGTSQNQSKMITSRGITGHSSGSDNVLQAGSGNESDGIQINTDKSEIRLKIKGEKITGVTGVLCYEVFGVDDQILSVL